MTAVQVRSAATGSALTGSIMGVALDPERGLPVPAPRGLRELATAVERARPLPEPAGLGSASLVILHQGELRAALRDGDVERAADAATALWRRQGLDRVYVVVEALLASVSAERAAGLLPTLQEQAVVDAADRLVARLRGRTPSPRLSIPGSTGEAGSPGVVLVAAGILGWDADAVAVRAQAHVLEDAGWRAVVVGEVDVLRLATEPGVVAVLLATGDRRRVTALRAAGVVVGVAGGGAPPSADIPVGAVALAAALRRGPLSAREADVLRCVADGLTNTETGEQLGIAAATVRTHLDHAFEKTGTTHRAAAVAVALRAGWVS